MKALDGVNLSLGAFDYPPPIEAKVGSAELRRREALTKRTDVQRSLQEYEAAQAALRLAVANQYPNVRLSSGYNNDLGVKKDRGADRRRGRSGRGILSECGAESGDRRCASRR
jgi:outer membrane protein TolC